VAGLPISIIYSSSDPAARNIVDRLNEMGFNRFPVNPFDGSQLTHLPEDNKKRYICLSTHKSERGIKSLTCHHTGNWAGEARFGGDPRDVCIAMPEVAKGIGGEMMKRVHVLPEYSFSLEVTHHGPTGNVPLVFVEIGSCAEDWGNITAGKIIAEALANFEESTEGEVVMGVGGPHYAPNFTKLLEKYRIGHIIPKYAVDGVEYETFVKGIERSTEKTEKVLIDWKGLDGKQREKIIGFCNRYGIDHIKYK